MDLFARTWESLDFGVVLERLSRECRTEMGRSRALIPDFKTTLEEVRQGLRERANGVGYGFQTPRRPKALPQSNLRRVFWRFAEAYFRLVFAT